MLTAASSSSLTLTPVGYSAVSRAARTLSPSAVVVAPMRRTITSWATSGLPRQFWVTWQNRRCSILFHLLVPGGRWHTCSTSPVASAASGSATLHSRLPPHVLPPPSATTSSSALRPYR